MTRILSYSSILIIIFGSLPAWSQEILSGIEINQTVRERYQQNPFLKSSENGILELPFLDDFSKTDTYPNPENWSDRDAFINSDYPVNPVSYNIATLDAIDHTGALYDHATTWPFIADHLTSRPVNLDYLPEDSIYISFFYQPQGKGDRPQSHDSLRLEFFSPITESWRLVWSVPGDSLHDFRLVMIPVVDADYLNEGFRFRFSNIASISDNSFNPGKMGNADHWHIDYVYLNKNRSYADTVFRDVAFIKTLGSLLNNYESMPWNQFLSGRLAEMASVLPVTYKNNDIVTRSIKRQYSIFDVYENTTVQSYSGGTVKIGPGEIQGYSADLTYSFNTANTDSASFRIKAWLDTGDFDYKWNDTVIYYQNFDNYFALDDGTSENGYGIYGGGSENAQLAYRFRAYRPDFLKAINIYFNQSLNHASRQYFKLAVWDDNNGKPGNLIYSQEGERPVYEGSLNKFHTYYLDSPVHISQVFYVGIIQTTSNFLNIGFDINRNNRNRIFYNLHGEWQNSSIEGSLMIRPVVGELLYTSVSVEPANKMGLNVFPNPVSNILYVDLGPEIEPEYVIYKLFNHLGQMVYQKSGNVTSIDISSLPPGIYFLRTECRSTVFETKKILITK